MTEAMAISDNDTPSIEQWTTVIKTCFQKRYKSDQVVDAFQQLWKTHSISGQKLAEIILVSGAQPLVSFDPMVPAYIGQLLQLKLIDTGDILGALFSQSIYATDKTIDSNDDGKYLASTSMIEIILTLVANLYISGERPTTANESVSVFRSLDVWLKGCNTYETVMQIQAEGLHSPDAGLVQVFEAVGTFIVIFLSIPAVKKHIGGIKKQEEKIKFADALGHFASTLSQWSTTQVPSRLHTLIRASPLSTANGDEGLNFTMTDVSDAVIDLPLHISKAGLYIHLKAALCSRPLLDDSTLINYLHARYPSIAQAMLVDLIRSSFDVLADSLRRQEPEHTIFCFRSFIANRLPLLILSATAGLYLDVSLDLAIPIGIGRILQFPPPDSGQITDILGNSEKDFVQSCQLHQVVSDDVVDGSLREYLPANATRVTRLGKDTLVTQCISNAHRAEELVGELESMRGNVGATSIALAETLQRLCNSKETMSLRTICNAISKRLPLVDIILQYVRLSEILMPLCTLLNDWQIEEDQSEYQPPYEEFASVLLLVLAIIHRYNLTVEDLGATGQDTFVSKLLTNISESTPTNDLTEEQNKHLTKWVQGLYATDDQGESSGISDETMSHCPPQAFYLLVPTLFEQSVRACQMGALSINTLKGGLEFLLEPFLLPSLVGGLNWLIRHSWEDHGDGNILMQVLEKLIRPTSISGDAHSMHQNILAIVARPLEQSLQELNRRVPNRKEISSLLDVLKPHLDSQRSSKSTMTELKTWTSTPEGGLKQCLTNLISELTTWSSWISQPGLETTPTTYTHRMLYACIDLFGSYTTLMIIVNEVTRQTAIGMGPASLEIATSLILAPFPTTSMPAIRPRPNLRQALKLRLADPKELIDMDTDVVETLVRLGRLVDAQSAVSQAAQLPMPLTNIGTEELMQGIGMSTGMGGNQVSMEQTAGMTDTTVAEFAAAMDQPMDLQAGAGDDMNLDLGDDMFASTQGMNFLETTTQQQQQQGQGQNQDISSFGQAGNENNPQAEEDIFAELDLGDMGDLGDDDFNF